MIVHPFANRFPMLSRDQLEELAASIREHGLDYSITVDQHGRLLDGRNRLAACKLVGIEPRCETVTCTEEQAIDLILRRNVQRRSLSESQKAMAFALAHPDAKHGGARRKASGSGPLEKPGKELIYRARLVLREFGPDSAAVRHIMNGGSLNDAFDDALRLRQEREGRAEALQRLRLTHPQFAARVDAGVWTVERALQQVQFDGKIALLKPEIAQKALAALHPVGDEEQFQLERSEECLHIDHDALEARLGRRIHPALDAWPLMPLRQLESLARDIKKYGLNNPIILDKEGCVLDGRLRLLACEMAQVEPKFSTYEGNKPLSLIVAMNTHRQHYSRSQQAIGDAWVEKQLSKPDPDDMGCDEDEYLTLARRVIELFGANSDVVKRIIRGGGLLMQLQPVLEEYDRRIATLRDAAVHVTAASADRVLFGQQQQVWLRMLPCATESIQ